MMKINQDEMYMRRCIQLAQNGLYGAPPNPMVGAVVVHDNLIIGEGYHARCGEAHAEVNAINSVKNVKLLRESTIYVSLEPCSHYGKTPPCTDLIIEKQIPRVVIGCRDPFDKVSGRGIKKLKEAGVEVKVGVLEEECRYLIRRFITFHTAKRPYITLKWAESADGYIDYRRIGGEAVKLSSPHSSMLVHKKRAEHSAIMVGTRTAYLDNPSLTVRYWEGKSPVRIVLDRNLSLPSSLSIFDGSQTTLLFTEKEAPNQEGIEYITLHKEQPLLPQILEKLYERNLQSLLVEGGSQLLQSFIDAELWDEIVVEECPCFLREGVPAPTIISFFNYQREAFMGRIYRHYERK